TLSHLLALTYSYSFNAPPPNSLYTSFPTRRSSDLPPARIGNTWRPDSVHHQHSKPRTAHFSRTSTRMGTARRRLRSVICHVPLRSEEHTSELQSRFDLVCRLLLEKKNQFTILLL